MQNAEIQIPILTMLIIVGVILIATAVGFVVFFYQKRVLAKEIEKQTRQLEKNNRMLKVALEAQESEHKRLAKELHDNVGMMLMTLRVNLSEQSSTTTNELRTLVDETNESVKKIAWSLMPTTLDNFGLFQSIQELGQRMAASSGITIHCAEKGKRQSLDKDQDLLIYRVAEEAILNALKHSHGSSVEVLLDWNDHKLDLAIKDDGVGFDFPQYQDKIEGRHGLGLYNLENRAALLKAETSYLKNSPSGAIVSVKIPIG